MTPPQAQGAPWDVAFDWQSQHRGRATRSIAPTALSAGKVQVTLPFDSNTTPGIAGQVRFVVSAWNA
jgi:hypothetical protein